MLEPRRFVRMPPAPTIRGPRRAWEGRCAAAVVPESVWYGRRSVSRVRAAVEAAPGGRRSLPGGLGRAGGAEPGRIGALERGVRRAPQRQTVALLADALGLSGGHRAGLEAAVERRRGPAAPRARARPEHRGPARRRPARRPGATVTFLFTDLEGSTRLLEAHPAAYRDAVPATTPSSGGRWRPTAGRCSRRWGTRCTRPSPAPPTPSRRPGRAAGAAGGGLGRAGAGALRARMGLHTGEVGAARGRTTSGRRCTAARG